MAAVGIVSIELHLPGARSLKDKRKIVQGLIDRLHHRHRVSIAETALHDLHQRAELTIAAVASDGPSGARITQRLREIVEQEGAAELARWDEETIDIL